MRMDFLGGGAMKVAVHPERSLHDTHWGYHFADCRLFPVTAAYRPDEMDPLVTVFLDAAQRRPGACRRVQRGSALCVILPSGCCVRFVHDAGGWVFAIPAGTES